MSNLYSVTCWYTCSSESVVALPVSWENIESWYVKWGVFYYLVKGEAVWREVYLDDVGLDSTDTSRPTEVEVHHVDEHGFPVGENLIEEN